MTALNPQETSWRKQCIIPVLVVDTVKQALAVGQTLLECGFPIVELTLRTPAALDAIEALANDVPDLVVGAGTVCSPRDLEAAVEAGARFLVSPGHTADLLKAGRAAPVPYLPGGVTASEFLNIRAAGYTVAKFFPADVSGGTKAIAALSAPLFDMSFVPTGGIGPVNCAEYLALPSVMAVGGSWMVPKGKLDDQEVIRALCKAARAEAGKHV